MNTSSLSVIRRIALGLYLTLFATVSLCPGQEFSLLGTAWRQYQFDPARTGFNPNENALSTKTVGGLVKDWTLTTGGRIDGGVAEVNGKLYLGTDEGQFYEVEAATGVVKWQFSAAGNVQPFPAVLAGVVYVFSQRFQSADVYALDAKSGALVWDYHITDTWGYLTDPVVANGVVYVATPTTSTTKTRLYALSARTGALIWAKLLPGSVSFAPALVENALYVSSFDIFGPYGNLYVLNAASGALKWTFAAGSNGNTGASGAAVADGTVYVSGSSGNSSTLYALSTNSHAVRWSFAVEIGGYPAFGNASVAQGKVYVCGAGTTYALDAKTGKMMWKNSDNCFGDVTVANGVLYLDSYKTVVALDAASGKRLWGSRAAFDQILSPPTVVNGMLLSGASDSNLYAYHLPAK